MLCLSAMLGWFIGSLDYSQAYLNADIDEDCYLRAPEFLRKYDIDGIEMVWKLKKVIYGHPKGSRLWAQCLDKKLKELGYNQLMTDQCVYAKWPKWDLKNLESDSHFIFILIHSDDLIIISNLKIGNNVVAVQFSNKNVQYRICWPAIKWKPTAGILVVWSIKQN